MTTLRKAIEAKQLRPVPLQEKGGLSSYRDEPWPKLEDIIGTRVAIVNVAGKFLMIKQPGFKGATIVSSSGIALVQVGNADTSQKELATARRKNKYIQVELTEETLDTNIIKLEDVASTLHQPTFSELALRAIKHEPLSQSEIISLLVDKRVSDVLSIETILTLTTQGLLVEFTNKTTDRARLFMQEVADGHKTPDSLALFTNDEIKILRGAKKLE